MFEDAVFKKDKNEVKRGLLSFPIAFGFQASVIVGLILFGIFTSTYIPAPEKNAVFDPVIIVPPPPPPPLGTANGDNKPKGSDDKAKTLEKDDLVIPKQVNDLGNQNSDDNGEKNDFGGKGQWGTEDGEEWMNEIDKIFKKEDFDKTSPTIIGPISVEDPDIVRAPKSIYTPAPQYPPEALRLGIKGTVVAIIVIDENGYVKEVNIEKSPNTIFEQAVKDTVKHWRFSAPVNKKGQKVSVYLRKTFVFRF